MSSQCLRSELVAAAKDHGLEGDESRRVIDLCLVMDWGAARGDKYGYPGEPGAPPETPGSSPGKPPPEESYLSADRLATDVLELLEDLRPDGADPLLPELDPFGRLGLVELLATCGVRPLDILPERQLNVLTRKLCWRDVAFVPRDWEDVLLPLAAQDALLNLVNPAALAAAHGEGP